MTPPELEVFCDDCLEKKKEPALSFINQNTQSAITAVKSGRNALTWACLGGSVDIVNKLISIGADVNQSDDAQWTPIHVSSSAGHVQIVELLLANKANVNATNETGQTPLHYACSKNHYEIAELLVKNGANGNIQDKHGATCLHRACTLGHVKIIQLLFHHKGTSGLSQLPDSEGNTPLHLACEGNFSAAAVLCVKNGAEIDALNKEEKTALSLATDSDTIRAVRIATGSA